MIARRVLALALLLPTPLEITSTCWHSATVCIVHLAETSDLRSVRDDPWFTRGWTLHELLAPQDVKFYNATWGDLRAAPNPTGSAGIESSVRDATTLTQEEIDLFRRGETEFVPISRRLQLAASRKVTREEDTAYSLMGLLGVSISVAYGEGAECAFSRLIRELLSTKKEVLDVFNHSYTGAYSSVVPISPKQYAKRWAAFDMPHGANKPLVSLLDKWRPSPPLLLTHVGLHMRLLLVPGLFVNYTVDGVGFTSNESFTRFSYASDIAYGGLYGHYQLYDLLHRALYGNTLPDWATSNAARAGLRRAQLRPGQWARHPARHLPRRPAGLWKRQAGAHPRH